MNRGILILAAVAVIGGLAITAFNRQSARRTLSNVSYQQSANSSSGALSRIQQPRTAIASQKASANADNSASLETNRSKFAVQNTIVEEPLHDPIARVALSMVGEDPDAEEYWFEAINDLSLPANERQNLIEDLNEEGLSDPQHPTIDDLPLILNRLALIETIGPDAADEVNADAFMEAYKDLLNLAQLAMGGGEPVR
jgi:hypothetical protein